MNRTRKLQTLLGVCSILFAGFASTGCLTSDNPRDPVKVEQVKAAIVPLASGAVRRVLVKNPELAPYVKDLGVAFAQLRDNAQFSPSVLDGLLNIALARQTFADEEDRQLAIDVKNALFAIYVIYYADRLNADVSEQEFLLDVADVLARTIGQAISDLGL